MGAYRIISYEEEPFENRVEAGQALARELVAYSGPGTVVLGIPRGGVVVAREVARLLDADLDVILARKVGAPGNPEAGIGAVSEDGHLVLDEEAVAMLMIGREYIEAEKRRQMAEITARAVRFRAVLPKAAIEGRTAILTDDGVATGSTMRAAAWAARQEHPSRIVIALPVAPESAVASLAEDADEVVCLEAPRYFAAVGQFYRDFGQTSDEEVIEILREAAERQGVR